MSQTTSQHCKCIYTIISILKSLIMLQSTQPSYTVNVFTTSSALQQYFTKKSLSLSHVWYDQKLEWHDHQHHKMKLEWYIGKVFSNYWWDTFPMMGSFIIIIFIIFLIIVSIFIFIIIAIIFTRPRPAFGRLGLGRLSGGKTSGVSLHLASRLRRSARLWNNIY